MASEVARTAAQADFTFQAAELESDALRVIGFEGSEGLGRLFEYHVDLSCENPALTFESLLGKPCLLRIGGPDGARFIHGMIRRFERTGQALREAYYAADVVPMHWLLTRRIGSRIFQENNCSDMSVPGIIKQVFTDAGIPADAYRLALEFTSYEAHEYVVQYRESELDFIQRLMEEEGIYYFFEHTAEGHKMVLADSGVAHVASALDAECTYREPTGLVPVSNSFFSLREAAEMHVGKVSLDDFDFIRPATNLRADAAGSEFGALKLSDYPGNFIVKARGTRLAKRRLEEHECRQRTLTLAGDPRGLAAGYKFTLKEHPSEALNREYLITHASVVARQSQSGESMGGEGTSFDLVIRTIPSDLSFRPPRLTKRPTVLGSQTAIVVGPGGEEIYTDKYGRVKVQFHWDQVGVYDENSSCWIRVSQGAAGGQYGMMFLPRVGQEVIVDFLEGDPDQPIITGRVYNNDQMPPYALPGEKTKSVIKTNSSTGGGGTNEIRFEDKAGSEQVLIFAQKDLHVRACGARVENVGDDRHLTVKKNKFELVKQCKHVEVTTDLNEKVGGKYSLDVSGDFGVKAGGNQSTEAGGKLYIKAGMEVVIEAGVGLTLKVGGNFIKLDPSGVSIQGVLVKINSGGAAGSGTAVALTAPEATIEADSAEPGSDTTYQADPATGEAIEPPGKAFTPPAPPETPEKITSWVEIELIDEEGQPIPEELYEITYPDGKTRRAKLDLKGQAHIGLAEPMEVKVTFPHLDAEAWERVE